MKRSSPRRFDALHGRFKRERGGGRSPAAGDRRQSWRRWPAAASSIWVAARAGLPGARRAGRVVWSGSTSRAAMLAEATGMDRVRASARRLPFGPASFDAGHGRRGLRAPGAASRSIDVCGEVRRVLRPGGTFVIVDKNVYSWNARRPWLPSVAVKWIDERRGLWMYSHRGPVRERWFRPGELQTAARAVVSRRSGSFTCSREPRRGGFRFSTCPARDSSYCGRPGRREAPRDRTVFADACVASAPLVEDAAGPGADPRPGRGGVRDGQGRASALVPRRPVRPVRRSGGRRRLARAAC